MYCQCSGFVATLACNLNIIADKITTITKKITIRTVGLIWLVDRYTTTASVKLQWYMLIGLIAH